MLGKIIYRFKQFWFGMFSRYTKGDAAFARNYLNLEEQAIFNQLPGFEKKHSVVVARKMIDIGHDCYPHLDQRKLAKLGLLHDIGKVVEKNSLLTKSMMVIIRFFLPKLYESLAEKGRTNLRWQRYYIHKHHGAVGAELLRRIGVSGDILSIIKKHDPRTDPFGPEDPIELKILQDADSTY